jgi:hypothetical protein
MDMSDPVGMDGGSCLMSGLGGLRTGVVGVAGVVAGVAATSCPHAPQKRAWPGNAAPHAVQYLLTIRLYPRNVDRLTDPECIRCQIPVLLPNEDPATAVPVQGFRDSPERIPWSNSIVDGRRGGRGLLIRFLQVRDAIL